MSAHQDWGGLTDTFTFPSPNSTMEDDKLQPLLDRLDVLEQRYTKLVLEHNQVQNTVARLQHANQTLQAQIASQPAAPSGGGAGLKMKLPDTFEGERAKLENWIHQIKLYLFGQHPGLDETRKVAFALMLLRGPAQDWARPILDRLQDIPTPPEAASLEALFTALRASYGEIDADKAAADKLMRLRQTGTVAEFASQFRALQALTGWPKDATTDVIYLDMFRKGLKDQVRQHIASTEAKDMKFDAYVNWVSETDEKLRLAHAYGPVSKPAATPRSNLGTTSSAPRTIPTASASSTKDPNAMEIDRVRRERRSKGLCYYCGEKDHLVSDCPTRPPSRNLKATRSTSSLNPSPPALQSFEDTLKRMAEQYVQNVQQSVLQNAFAAMTPAAKNVHNPEAPPPADFQ